MRLGLDDLAKREAYQALFASAIDQGDPTEIRDCTHKGWVIVSDPISNVTPFLMHFYCGRRFVICNDYSYYSRYCCDWYCKRWVLRCDIHA